MKELLSIWALPGTQDAVRQVLEEKGAHNFSSPQENGGLVYMECYVLHERCEEILRIGQNITVRCAVASG